MLLLEEKYFWSGLLFVRFVHCWLAGELVICCTTSKRASFSRLICLAQGVSGVCRPAKRARQQGTSRALQSQRQAWMEKLTSEAAQEVQQQASGLQSYLVLDLLQHRS